MVTMVHCEGGEGVESEDTLARHLLHSCHLSLHIKGLPSGYSRDVHGLVSTVRGLASTSVLQREIMNAVRTNVHLMNKTAALA